jgi:hypothetical protein
VYLPVGETPPVHWQVHAGDGARLTHDRKLTVSRSSSAAPLQEAGGPLQQLRVQPLMSDVEELALAILRSVSKQL